MISFPYLHKAIVYWMFAAAFCGGRAMAQRESMDCTKEPSTHVSLAESDQNSATHLQVIRKIAAGASITLDVCEGDLVIKGGKDDNLQVTVDFDNGDAKHTAGDYLHALEITPQAANIKLYLPKHQHAKVIIVVPAMTPRLQVDLVSGNLSFETDRIAGERKINVVYGHVEVLANVDSYKTLDASILLGSFHDHRGSHEEAHGMFSDSLTGTGRGTIEINVVRGSLDLKAWD